MTAVQVPTSPTTLDVVALQLAQVKPENLYSQAAHFDDMARLLGEITDGFRGVLRCVEEAWRCHEADGLAPAIGTPSVEVLNLLGELQSQDTGSLLRTAGDSLARAQTQIHDLQLRRMQDAPATALSVGGSSSVAEASQAAMAAESAPGTPDATVARPWSVAFPASAPVEAGDVVALDPVFSGAVRPADRRWQEWRHRRVHRSRRREG